MRSFGSRLREIVIFVLVAACISFSSAPPVKADELVCPLSTSDVVARMAEHPNYANHRDLSPSEFKAALANIGADKTHDFLTSGVLIMRRDNAGVLIGSKNGKACALFVIGPARLHGLLEAVGQSL